MSHRPSSMYSSTAPSSSTSQSSALQSRITQKKAELENLRQLRDLSAQLAQQMSALEARLATLRDGTEAVAEVLRNWSGVVRVLGMVGEQLRAGPTDGQQMQELPPTLVRIPVQGGSVVTGEAGSDQEDNG